MAQKQVRSTRPSARVFRRRRLAVFISLLVVVGLLLWAGFGMASMLRPADPGTEPSDEATDCLEGDVVIGASTAQGTHGPAQNPVLVMSIKNEGKFDCK